MNTAPHTTSPLARLRGHSGFLLVVLALVLIAGVRFRLRDCPLERDEGEYAYAGQLLLQGIPPYELAYNMKFPGTYAAYATIMAVFGQTPAGIHLGVLCLTSLTALMLYWLGRQIVDETTGVVAAISCAFLSASPSMLGLAGHATHFAAFFATAGLCVLHLAWQSKRVLPALIAGFLFGVTLLMKQQAVFIGLWGFVMLALVGLRQRQEPWAQRLRLPAAAALGTVLPFGIMCLILWRAGVFGKFWFWTIDYARQYVSLIPSDQIPALFRSGFTSASDRCSLVWLTAAAGLVALFLDVRLRGIRFALAGFLLASFLTTVPGFYFRYHYFLLMVPALSLLAGCAISSLWHLSRRRTRVPWLAGWPALAYALALGVNTLENWDVWGLLTPAQASRGLYGAGPFPEAEVVATYIREHSRLNEKVAVLGSEPEIYFLSRRHSATGYLYTYPLMEPQPYAHTMHEEMIREIETAQPKFIVFVRVEKSWLPRPKSDHTLLDWWYNTYRTNYALVGMAEILSINETRYAWTPETLTNSTPDSTALLLFQRKL